MSHDIEQQFCASKRATVIKCKDGIATIRVDNRSDGCHGCDSNRQSNCALYTFGSIFSPHRDIWQLPSKHSFSRGEHVKLVVQSSALLKMAIGFYGIPIVILLASTLLIDLLVSIEWLSVTVGLGSLMMSYPLAKRWFNSSNIPPIQIIR